MTTDDVAARWDAQLLNFADYSVYQSSRWGRYKHARGWRPEYFRATRDGDVVSMAQVLVKRLPLGMVVAWCPGGPLSALEACSRGSMRHLASLLNARMLYCRANLLRSRVPDDEEYLRANGWTRPTRTVSANLTAVWDLRQPQEALLAGLNRNWRYSLRQAQKAGLAIEHLKEPPIQELADLCRAMNVSKGVRASVEPSDMAALFETLDDRVVVYGCRNEAGHIIAFHSCVIEGTRCWELVAATSQEGRRAGASFAVLWALVLHCQGLGVTHYDLAGMDPVRAPGVADFKRWTGACDVEWLGEWEWCTSSVLRRGVNLAIGARPEAGIP